MLQKVLGASRAATPHLAPRVPSRGLGGRLEVDQPEKKNYSFFCIYIFFVATCKVVIE